MKITWILWWVATSFWLLTFAVGAVFIWLREVDGAGAVQTPELKLAAIAVWLIVFIFPIIIQIVWLIINIIVGGNKRRELAG